jgi:integrase
VAGVPYIRPYDMRHTAATLLLLEGIHPKVVIEMLGHSSVTITLTIYSHVLPMIQRDAALAMDRILRDQNSLK